jgi:hypothetical protein
MEAVMTHATDPARVARVRREHEHVLSSLFGDCDGCFLLTQLDRAEAERDELRTSRDILEAKLTAGTTSLRNAASLLEDPSVIATAGLYLTSAQHSQIVREFAQVKAERDEAQAGARTIILEYDRLRASLAAAREALERIAKRPDLPNPERDADWKACMKLSAQEARAALTSIGAQAEKPGAQGAPELERREQ